MQRRPGPALRPVARRRRPTRQQIARRRVFVVVVLLNLVLLAFLLWPRGDDGGQQAAPGPTGSGAPEPGEWPIEHVIFMIKENRTFDHYFGQYPGADGVTVGNRM